MQPQHLLKGVMVTCLFVSLFGIANADLINITDYDGRGYLGQGVGGEDEETEPGMINEQWWDLEGFYMNENELSMVGGFNFEDGYTHMGQHIAGGDIFIDVTGDVDGLGNGHYEFVIDMDVKARKYDVFSIGETAELGDVYWYNDPESNPFNYISGGTPLFEDLDLSFAEYSGAAFEATYGVLGGQHYMVSGIDLTFLEGTDFTVHYTMECGNDNLMGSRTGIPEPGTFSLLFMGSLCMIGSLALRRKRKNNR